MACLCVLYGLIKLDWVKFDAHIKKYKVLGHLHELASGSGLAAHVDVGEVPLLPDVPRLLAEGYVAGGTTRNVQHLEPHLVGGTSDARIILGDAQTSGGLLLTCEPAAASDAVAQLTELGHDAAVIGALHDGQAGQITIAE